MLAPALTCIDPVKSQIAGGGIRQVTTVGGIAVVRQVAETNHQALSIMP
jgi:hypothetical protein